MALITNPEPNLVALEGEIDLHESPRVHEKLNQLIEQKLPKIYVDMTKVSYIDSSGLAALIDAMQKTQKYSGQLLLVGMRQNIRNIFEIARLDQVFKIYDDLATAKQAE